MEKIKISWEKRTFDIVVSVLVLVGLSPLLIVITLGFILQNLLSRASQGNIFYTETRISQGRPFRIYKFRIFTSGALKEAGRSGPYIQTKDLEKAETNLTFMGKLLKRVYLDELPQFLNVLKGDMSIVGPRPTNPVNYERGLAKGNRAKYLLKAGITGYFQSHKSQKLLQTQEELDMEYAKFCQENPGWKVVLYDLSILFITLRTIVKAQGV